MAGSASQIKASFYNDELILARAPRIKGFAWDVRTNMVVTTLSTESPVMSIE